MWVEFIGNDDPVLAAARRLSKCSADECVSAEDVARDLKLDQGGVLAQLERLMELDWVVKDGDAWTSPATPRTRWITREHSGLTPGKHYEVLGIEADSYRVLDDRDDPILYDPSGFRVVDSVEPTFWTSKTGEDGERYAYPGQWVGGFFEDYHDGVRRVRDEFWNDLSRLYPETYEERSQAG